MRKTLLRFVLALVLAGGMSAPSAYAAKTIDGPCTGADIGDTKVSDGSKYRCMYYQRGKLRLLFWVYQGPVKPKASSGKLTADQAAACFNAFRENKKKPKYCP